MMMRAVSRISSTAPRLMVAVSRTVIGIPVRQIRLGVMG